MNELLANPTSGRGEKGERCMASRCALPSSRSEGIEGGWRVSFGRQGGEES